MKALLLLLALPVAARTCHKTKNTSESATKTIIMQPGPDKGQDCTVAYRETDNGERAAGNMNELANLCAARGTWNYSGAGEGSERGFIKFTELDQIPQNAKVRSAMLSLYGVDAKHSPEITHGNSYYPNSNYNEFGPNKTWLKRVTEDWDATTINWNNQPATTDEHRAEPPVSTSQWNFDALDIDVTKMVQDIVSTKQNYGFCLQLQEERIYKFIVFGSCEVPNESKRPKLVVVYETSTKAE